MNPPSSPAQDPPAFANDRWKPALFAAFAFAVAAPLGWHTSVIQAERVQSETRRIELDRLNRTANELTAEISQRQAILAALVAFAEGHAEHATLREEFDIFAAGLCANDPTMRMVEIFPPEGPILAFPRERNAAILDRTLRDLMEDERTEVRADVQRTIASGHVTLSQPYRLRQGGYGLVARQSIFRQGRLWGVAAVVLDVPALLQRAGVTEFDSRVRLVLTDGKDRVIHGDPAVRTLSPVTSRVSLPEGAWNLAAAPLTGWSAQIIPAVRRFQVEALSVVLLFTGLTYAVARRQTRLARAVALRTRELNDSAAEARRLAAEAERARQATELSRAQIVETLERMSDGFATLDREWHYTYVNPRVAEFVGRRREDLVGRKIWSIFPEAIGTPVHEAYERAMAAQQPIELEHHYAPLGRWFQHRFYPSAGGLTVFSRDITERRLLEESLRATQEHFRQLVMEAPLPLCFITDDGRVGLMNDRFVGTFGYTHAELPTLEHWWQVAYPDPAYRQEVVSQWTAAVQLARQTRSELAPAEYRVTRKDGQVRRVEIAGATMRGGFLATAVDVTDRREAEDQARAAQQETARLLAEAEQSRRVLLSVIEDQKEAQTALRANEERYRNLVETSFDWVWEIDAQCRYTYCSPRVTDLLGYSVGDLLGRTPFDLMPPAEAERVRREFADITAARRAFASLENTNCHRDGRLVVLESNGVPVFAADGSWQGYRGMDRDITARRAAEVRLRLHGAALEAAANAVVITNRAGCIEWVNPAFTTLSGWSLSEVAGRSLRELQECGEHEPAFHEQMWDTLAAGRVWRGEITNRRKDGQLRTEDMTITPLRDARSEITHFIAIKQDITEHKLMEQQFLQSQRMEAIGTLAGGIAHDLNNILAPILMIAGVLKDKLVAQADRDLLALTQTSAQRGADIVKQLLAFSRGQPGHRSAVQSRYLIREVVHMMRETFPREIELYQRAPADLWTVVADPTQLHQVLLNLCVNARDAMPNGGRLSIEASNVRIAEDDPVLPHHARPGPYVAIDVSDTGTGIPPEIRHRIFDPFFTTKELGKGTGLGLSTVLGIVQQHGGFVTLESTVGQGARFRIHLPASPEAAAGKAETVRPPAPPAAATHQTKALLLVDDELPVRDTARLLLEQRGFKVLTAAHGQEALTCYLQNRAEIRLVITDLMMPVMGGMPLVRALHAIEPELRIVVASGLSEMNQRQELEALGVKGILAKPYDGALLFDVVRRWLPDS